jgi:hypothetical protein
MVVMQKWMYGTATHTGAPFERFAFMAFLTSLSKALLFLPAVASAPKEEPLSELVVRYTKKVWFAVGIWLPSLLCESLGLMLIPASLMVMLRTLNIPITGAVRHIYLGQQHTKLEWALLVMITAGVGLGSLSQVYAAEHGGQVHFPAYSISGYSVGVFAGICTAALTALRFVVEEKLICKDGIPPLMVVGIEGLLLLSGATASLVACHFLGIENMYETGAMLYMSSSLQLLLVAYLGMNMAYSHSSVMVSQLVDSTCRAVIRGVSIYGVWALQLSIFAFTAGAFGEAWQFPRSIYYAGAMCITVCATVGYSLLR